MEPMIEVTIPGRGRLQLQHLVSDVNGTLALDGVLIAGVAQRLAALAGRLTIHLLTADTLGRQSAIDRELNLTSTVGRGSFGRPSPIPVPRGTGAIIAPGNEQQQKQSFVEKLGAASVIALGQGANDALMLKTAALGICILSAEGASAETVMACDLIVPSIDAAFDLLDKPLRLVASLRK
jgi:soluble P-type ATPase